MKVRAFLFATLALSVSRLSAQDDLLQMLDSAAAKEPKSEEYVTATFKAIKVINAQSVETVKSGTLDFRVTHRFGNIGVKSNGGVHTLYGFDQASNIRLSFDYGINDRLMVGIGRSKVGENLDASVKHKFLEQTKSAKIPVTLVWYSDMVLTPVKDSSLKTFDQRLSYAHQLIIGRKFSDKFSLALLPSYVHRNFIRQGMNPANGVLEGNDLFSLGLAGRLKFTTRMAFVFDYFYTMSDYYQKNPNFRDPMSVGLEIETGGHVFHLNFSNSSGIIESDFLTGTTDSWDKGGYKFGFNISRVFTLKKSGDRKKE